MCFEFPYNKNNQGRPRGGGGGVVEYQTTQNIPSNIPKITLKLVWNAKIKKNAVHFVGNTLYPILSIKILCTWN